MVSWPCYFGPVTIQYIIARGRKGLFTSWCSRSKERDRKGLWFQYPLQGHTPSDLTSSHEAPFPKGSTTSPVAPDLGTKPGLWGTLPNHSIIVISWQRLEVSSHLSKAFIPNSQDQKKKYMTLSVFFWTLSREHIPVYALLYTPMP